MSDKYYALVEYEKNPLKIVPFEEPKDFSLLKAAESFTKAFTRFHGFTPTDIRQKKGILKSFNRLRIKLKVEGGKLLNIESQI